MVWAVSSVVNSISDQNASNAQQQAAVAAQQQQQIQFNQQQQNIAPYLASGTQNLAALNAAMPSLTSQFTMQDFQQNPGYQFQLGQGEQAMQRSAAASGMLNSTGTQQNLNNYAQGMANTDYQQALQNFTSNQQQRYNMMSGMAGMGMQAAGMANASSQNYANNYGNLALGIGNAQAAGSIGEGNAISQGVSGIGTMAGAGSSNFLQNMFGGGQPNNPMQGATNGINNGNGLSTFANQGMNANSGDNMWAGGGPDPLVTKIT